MRLLRKDNSGSSPLNIYLISFKTKDESAFLHVFGKKAARTSHTKFCELYSC